MGHFILPLGDISKYLDKETWFPLQSKGGEKVSGDILVKFTETIMLASQIPRPEVPSSPLSEVTRNSSGHNL